MLTLEQRQMAMYGCDIAEFYQEIKDSITYKFAGAYMVVAGLMSDAQEELARGANEQARQTLNRAKYILMEIMQGNLVGTVAR
jgi:hypothetical protein